MGFHADRAAADIEALTDEALLELLRKAENEERSMSHRRRVLQSRLDDVNDQIDALNAFAEVAFGSLSALVEEERALSTVRLQLHQRITELRLERSRRVDGPRPHLRALS